MKKTKIGKGNQVAGPMPSAESKARERKYQGEDDLRTLTRADEIRSDHSRMSNVRSVHSDHMSALQKMGRSIGGHDPKKRGGRRRRGRGRRGRR
jgi:hypothetical protein